MAFGVNQPAPAISKTLGDLLAADSSWTLTSPSDHSVMIRGVTHDSRHVRPGDLFVALRGGYFDGHDYIEQAAAQGAVALLVEQPVVSVLPQIIAGDSRAALARIAAAFYDHPSRSLGVIGVTGTDGKTTTSHLIEAILAAAGLTTGMIGTVGARIGSAPLDHQTRQTTPESIDVQRMLRQMADARVNWAIIEATSHGLDLHRLDDVDFDIGAVTNITHEHLEYHGTIANYRRAKGILFERVAASGGHAIVNLDDDGAREMRRYAGSAPVLTYSMAGAAADIIASNIELTVSGARFHLATPSGAAPCSLPLVGGFNVANALCAVGIGLAVGVPLDVIVTALASAPAVPGRMAQVDEGQPFNVIVDYAHTPDSLTKVLQLLRSLNPDGRLIGISGSAGERDTAKRPLQGAVMHRHADISIFTTEDPRFEDPLTIIRDIANGAAAAGGTETESFHCIVDRREAIRRALMLAAPGDTVLLAGKGHEQSIIWGLEKRPWDEEAITRELLRELGYGRQ